LKLPYDIVMKRRLRPSCPPFERQGAMPPPSPRYPASLGRNKNYFTGLSTSGYRNKASEV